MLYDFIKKQTSTSELTKNLLESYKNRRKSSNDLANKENSRSYNSGDKHNTNKTEHRESQTNIQQNSKQNSFPEETWSVTNSSSTSHQQTSPIRTSLQDYINEFKSILVQEIKSQWLKPNPNKKYLSVTEVIGCPLQVWLKLSGSLTEEDIEEDKIFYLLLVYAEIGDTVHEHVYRKLKFQHKEKMVYDKTHFLRGKFDIIDNTFLIDIKSSQNKSNHAPQLALYLHLAELNNYKITKAGIWYVLRDEIEEYDIDYLRSLIPKYLERAKLIKHHLETRTMPSEVDEDHCKYCLIHKKCQQLRSSNKVSSSDKSDDDIILTFDIKL